MKVIDDTESIWVFCAVNDLPAVTPKSKHSTNILKLRFTTGTLIELGIQQLRYAWKLVLEQVRNESFIIAILLYMW